MRASGKADTGNTATITTNVKAGAENARTSKCEWDGNARPRMGMGMQGYEGGDRT
jgi:hypothetical protein